MVGAVSGSFSFGDKVIWDSHFGYDIATFIGEGSAYEHWKIELHSGKFRHIETMVSKSELHHYSKELIAEMTKNMVMKRIGRMFFEITANVTQI